MQIDYSILKQADIIKFKEPNLLFQTSQTSEINNAMEGIQTLGPYDFNNNERLFDKIQIIVISPKDSNELNIVIQMLNYLKKGLEYFKGFESMFRLEDLIIPTDDTEVLIYDPNDKEALIYDLNNFYPISRRPRNQMDCVITFGNDHKAIKSTNNYYDLKKICLKNGYPIQYLSSYSSSSYSGVLQKLDDPKSLQYILWNICVAIYSKVGGIPWILSNENAVDITMGIRFSRNENEGYTTGFVSIFNKFGKYYGIFSKTFPDEEYGLSKADYQITSGGMTVPEVLIKRIIEESIESYYKFHSQKINSIAIHKIGKFGKDEIIGFDDALKYKNIKKYSLIEIYNKNLQRIFKLNKDSLNIDRGICFPFNKKHGFLCTTGDYQYKMFGRTILKLHKMGTPKPILVNLRKNNDCYKNFIDACQDIFTLTGLHYQTIIHNEIRLPASLVFAHNVAKFVKYGIQPHDLLKNTPWFL